VVVHEGAESYSTLLGCGSRRGHELSKTPLPGIQETHHAGHGPELYQGYKLLRDCEL